MQLASLRGFALSLPHTSPSAQWGGVAFKVEGKVFLHVVMDAMTIESVVFKCEPDDFDALTDIDGVAQAPYFARRHWVALTDPGALPAAELQRRIRHSYDLVVAKLPKKVQVALTGAPRFRVSERSGHRAPRL